MTKKTTTFLIFLAFFIIYYAGSFSKISFGDCIGFVLDVEKREYISYVTPLSHFLYINTATFFTKELNLETVMVMRMMSVIPAALTATMLYILIKEFVEENWIAVMSTFIFGLGFTFWRSAETVEVYTYNAFWVILFLVYAVRSLKRNAQTNLILAGLFLGISFWVHIQNIMLIPAYFLMLYYLRKDRKNVLLSLASFLFLFSLMFFINHLNGIELKYVFMTRKGPWVQDTFNQGFLDLAKDVLKSFLYLIYNFSIFIIFSFTGIVYLYRNFRIETIFLCTAALFTLGFATFYAVSDNYVYFIPFYLIFALFVASGIKKLSDRYQLRKFRFVPVFIPLFYVICLYIVSIIPQSKDFQQEKAYKGGLSYYMLPWLHNNIGCIEFTLDNGQTTDNVEALKLASKEFIELRKKYQTLEEIREL